MYLTGFADEAGGGSLDLQIQATRELGWNAIETRNINGKNLASLSDLEFERVQETLAAAGVSFNAFGSGIANWSKPITESPESSYAELRAAIPRMCALGIRFVRVMSFAVPPEIKDRSWQYEDEVVRRMQTLVRMAEDGGVVCLHENCMNWGGLSHEHTLRLLERIDSPHFKLVFDTGNPVVNDDVRGEKPYRKQDAWEFYRKVREHIAHVHVKDARVEPGGADVFTFPGEGDAQVRRILTDLFARGYDGGISIEPHMVRVFHDTNGDSAKNQEAAYLNYIEYGRRMEAMIAEIRSTLPN